MKINDEFIAALNPCSYRHENYLKHYAGKEFSALEFSELSEISVQDKIWVFLNSSILTDIEKRKLACIFARHVLHFFERKYPGDNRPRRAIEVVEDEKSTEEEIKKASREAVYAAAAADAAYAAAASYAAAAAYAASYAAAYAASAYAYVTYSDADYALAEREFQLKQILKMIKERK